jgi:hypothetical protein
MKIKHLLLVAVLLLPATSLADNIGECGWGSKLFDGQQGIAPQVLAVTTNGTFGNQTFAISSGTSGCTQMGKVRSAWRTAAYIDSNMPRVARDMSRGHGESLDALASILKIKPEHQGTFRSVLQDNFEQIFATENTDTETVVASIEGVMSQHTELAQYVAAL